jgi:hypothetical protein
MDVIRRIGYSDGSIAKIPDDTIWRYTDFGKFVSMLANRALYFSVLAAFDDQLETALPVLPEGSSEKTPPLLVLPAKDFFEAVAARHAWRRLR